MDFGIVDLLQIVGALSFFVYGMKMMSDGVQRAAGAQLRNILRTMTKNRFLGVGTGFLTTALVQSSSATTVMTVSFVNAGLLTLVESAGVMMGANIGTTITGWIVSILGFKIKLSAYSIPLFAVGVPMLFSGRNRIKYWGEFVIGFAILFLGLSYLKGAVPDLKGNPEVLEFLANFTNWGILSRILFVAIGTLVTIMVQSSSAAMAITLTMCAQGWLPFEVAAAMILGENIGTTITAEIASLVGNTNAKRSARIHSMFNIIGVAWMVILLPYFLPVLTSILQSFIDNFTPFTDAEDVPIALSAFHTAFNLLNVLIMVGFVNTLVKVAIWSVPESEGEDDHRLKFITSSSRTPELATAELQKEAANYGVITSKMNKILLDLLQATKAKEIKKLHKKIKKYEKATDQLEIEITEYITKLSDKEITPDTSVKLRTILNICNDLERIGDLYYQISMTIQNLEDQQRSLSDHQKLRLREMVDLLDQAFAEMNINLKSNQYNKISLSKALSIEDSINDFRNSLRTENNIELGTSGYNVQTAMSYNNLFSTMERIGDHIINVQEAIKGQI